MGIVTRVLVIDDEADTALLIQQVLERDGHAVTAVTSPKEALDLISRDDFDVVVTDLAMSEMSGLEVCERVVAARPETPVIVITGKASIQAAVDAMRVGAYDFITKPVEKDVLSHAVARASQKSSLGKEVVRLRHAIDAGPRTNVFGSSSAMRRVQDLIARVATSGASVLIHGETGTGKELVARAIHDASGDTGPFVALNCAAVPVNLLESELFGHARGAYTDAHASRNGLFVEANGGTIFLDEIAEMPLEIQPKLLRALQERKVRPIGTNTEVSFNARLVTATNRDLDEEVREKRFRDDLYYRINVIKLDLPPLRERGGDVVELATQFLAQNAERSGKPALKLSSAAAQKLLAYSWPGNVRELENCVERAVALCRSDEVHIADLPEKLQTYNSHKFVIAADDTTEIVPLVELERRYILRVLLLVGGNKARAALALGLDRKTLYRKLKRFGVPLSEVVKAKTTGAAV